MYPVNTLFSQTDARYVAAIRLRVGQVLVGPIDGVNVTFLVPGGDKFTHILPFFTAEIFFNGVLLKLLDDYTIAESGGLGTGYDTIVLETAPFPGDHLLANYTAKF